MIIDKLDNIKIYYPAVKNLDKAMKIIEKEDFDKVGKYEYDWGYIMVQEGMTKHISEGYFESHEKYIDLQILKEGIEVLSWINVEELLAPKEYNQEKDVIHYIDKIVKNTIEILPNIFYICFPKDGHKAVRHIYNPMNYKKIVVKILI